MGICFQQFSRFFSESPNLTVAISYCLPVLPRCLTELDSIIQLNLSEDRGGEMHLLPPNLTHSREADDYRKFAISKRYR